MDRLNKDYEIEFVNLDEIEDLDLDHKLTIFSDLGSGQGVDKNAKDGQKILILDHHPPLRDINYKNDKAYKSIQCSTVLTDHIMSAVEDYVIF